MDFRKQQTQEEKRHHVLKCMACIDNVRRLWLEGNIDLDHSTIAIERLLDVIIGVSRSYPDPQQRF